MYYAIQVLLLAQISAFFSNMAQAEHSHSTEPSNQTQSDETSLVVVIAVRDSVEALYSSLKGNQPCHKATPPSDHGPHRSLVELILICQAFHATGENIAIELFVSPSYQRSLRSVERGITDISAESIWYVDINKETVFIGQAIVQDGELEKGLYAEENHPVFDLQKGEFAAENYTGVTIRHWYRDQIALNAITPNFQLIHDYTQIFNVLNSGRVDFGLFPIARGENMSITTDGITIKPIPGVKVSIPGSRHLVMSKLRPNSKEKYALFNKGLNILRKQGKLKEFLYESGVRNHTADNWQILNAR